MQRGDLSWAITVFQERHDDDDLDQVRTVETDVDGLGILKGCCCMQLGGRQTARILQCL